MNEIEEVFERVKTISFKKRAIPISPSLRLHWRIAHLILILNFSNRKQASYRMLQALNWGIKKSNMEIFKLKLLNPESNYDFKLAITNDPYFEKAINLANGEGLVQIKNGNRIKLTEKGASTVNEIIEDDEIFIEEIEFLTEVRNYLKLTILDSKSFWG